jgi:uncharacterized protein YjbI with pentapeptide repeats
MANREHLRILKQGVEAWNAWRRENPDIKPNLFRANLAGTSLYRVNFRKANLREANLSGTDLREGELTDADLGRANLAGIFPRNARIINGVHERLSTNLHEANLTRANLTNAFLGGANLTRANLTHALLFSANLRGVNLRGANLHEAALGAAHFTRVDLTGACVSGAYLGQTVLGDANLTGVRGLETCSHQGPSHLDYHTLAQSGPLPLAFLRGCGLPDTLIDYLPSLLNEPFQFYSCFISYASKDDAFARRLHADLQNHGVRCWFAPEDLKIGDRFRSRIDETIRLYDKLLLVLSKTSVASQWVEQEVETALARERQQGTTILFPVRIDNTVMTLETGWPALIRNTRNIGDFRRWKTHDVYQQAFDRLLRDLKAAERQPEGSRPVG